MSISSNIFLGDATIYTSIPPTKLTEIYYKSMHMSLNEIEINVWKDYIYTI